MKKGIIIAILIVIIVAAAGFFGWVQLRMPADTYAIGYSKFGGFEEAVFTAGEFRWRAARLFPRGYTLYRFPVSLRTVDLRFQGELLSGAVYGAVLEGSPDFRYDLPFSISYQIRPDALPGLIAANRIRPDTLVEYQAVVEQSIRSEIFQQISDYISDPDNATAADYTLASMTDLIRNAVIRNHPELEILQFAPGTLVFPDIALYERGRAIYATLMTEKQEMMKTAMRAISDNTVREEQRLNTLRQYGELLVEYPQLIDYFAIKPNELPRLMPDPVEEIE